MIVLVAGMPRSGSTFSFNIVRETLALKGRVLPIATDNLSDAFGAWSGEDHLVIKSHWPDDQLTKLTLAGAVPCICTHRRPEDAVASWIHVFGHSVSEAMTLVERWLKWHRQVAGKCLNLPFSDIETRPIATIRRIQRCVAGRTRLFAAIDLRRRYDRHVIREQMAKLQEGEDTVNIGFSYYDKKTFFHRAHVPGADTIRAAAVLSPQDIELVRRQLAPYVDANGEYLGSETTRAAE